MRLSPRHQSGRIGNRNQKPKRGPFVVRLIVRFVAQSEVSGPPHGQQ